jgi:hypothetical protein
MNELEMFEARKQALINIPDQIRELEEKLTSIRSQTADSISVKGGNGSKDDAYLNNIVARDCLQANLEASRRSVSRVSGALNILTDEERRILERFYMTSEKGAAFDLEYEKKIDRKTVYRLKDAALAKFTCAMYGNK